MSDTITACRLCGSARLQHVYNLGDQSLSTEFVRPEQWELLGRYPLELVICDDCDLLQLAHDAPMHRICEHYWYRSGTNDTMRAALRDVVDTIVPPGTLIEYGSVWLDIGANDGTLLSMVPDAYARVACEPATNLRKWLSDHTRNIIRDFWSAEAYERLGFAKAKVVTAIAVLYAQPDPNRFVADIARVLADDGIAVFQLMGLKHMLTNLDIGNCCHEHMEHYSYANLVQLMESNGLEIYEVKENSVNGGSYRIYCRHLRDGSVGLLEPFVERDDIAWFIHDVEEQKDEVVDIVHGANADGKSVWIYGASTKGNVMLQYWGLTNKHIVAAADRNPRKHGLVMSAGAIPIVSEAAMRLADPDYLLMLPYGFRQEFIEREAEWHDRGGRWIIPFPNVRVV